jgi:hypothetical protein
MGRSHKYQKLTGEAIRDFFSSEGDMYWYIDDVKLKENWKNF